MKRKGFTLVELLVVIAIIAMLLAILMPALSRVRQLAYQMICGTNLSGVGKAILLYSTENEEKYPEFGPGGDYSTTWGTFMQPPYVWGARNCLSVTPQDPVTTISCSLYLVVKYADVSPPQFLCSAHKATKFELDDYQEELDGITDAAEDLTEAWDFGPAPSRHVSFAYNLPYWRTSPDGSSAPAVPLMADRNPWIDTDTSTDRPILLAAKPSSSTEAPQLVDYSDENQKAKFNLGNSPNHNLEGQNVLFNDMHVKFTKTPNVGVDQDNIYTLWDENLDPQPKRQQGKRVPRIPMDNMGGICDDCPTSEDDAILLNW